MGHLVDRLGRPITYLRLSLTDRCNLRLRLTADGILGPCLLREGEVDLKTAPRAGASDEEIGSLIRLAVAGQPAEGTPRPPEGLRSMREIGG